MRKRTQTIAVLSLLALLASACGGEEDGEKNDAIVTSAWLRVGAQLVHGGPLGDPERVAAVEVELIHPGGTEAVERFELRRLGSAQLWEGLHSLPPGEYEVLVHLYEEEGGAARGALPAFTSRILTRELEVGSLEGLLFLLDARALPGGDGSPHFEAVAVGPLVVTPRRDLEIEVFAGGGSGRLRFEVATADGSVLAEEIELDEKGYGAVSLQAPPIAGLQALLLQAADPLGEVAQLGVSFLAGGDQGAVFPLTWNLAPTISVQSHLRQGEEGPEIQLLLRAADDRSASLTYVWEGTCAFQFMDEAGGPAEGPYQEAGAGAERGMPFLARLSGMGSAGCVMAVTVTDEEGAFARSEIIVDESDFIDQEHH